MIDIVVNETDKPVIKRLKASLSKKFNANSEGDIDNAVRLANYLVAIDKVSEAENLLNSFLYFNYSEKPEKLQHLWPANGQGIVLLSHIQGFKNDEEERKKTIKSIMVNDYNESSSESPYQRLLYDYRNNEHYLNYYVEESHKYRCEILSQECLTFIYWKETWDFILYKESQRFDSELEKIESVIDKCYLLLRKEILG